MTTTADKADELTALGEKALSPAEIVDKSVVGPPIGGPIPSSTGGMILWVANIADQITPWGGNQRLRDKQLRDFIAQENFFASALGIICARNTAFSWELSGPPRTMSISQDMLLNSYLGQGWEAFVAALSIDLYTQDNGAFVELIRDGDSETSPVVGITVLDSARCWQTGHPQTPVVYQDRRGQLHLMKWYQVYHLMELPAPIDWAIGPSYRYQYCALTRMLRSAQILCNVAQYKDEKTGGRFNRGIHLIKGVTAEQIQDAIAKQTNNADQQLLKRYIQPLMVSSIDPKAEVGHDTIELATMPEGWDEEKTIKNYITIIAMAFMTDYQEFAPLPGGNLGSSSQSEILHMKSRGKGPGLFMKLMARLINFSGILPRNVEFKFAEPDYEAEKQKEDLKLVRAQRRKMMVDTGSITPQASALMAVDEGDLDKQIFAAMGGLDITEGQRLSDIDKLQADVLSQPGVGNLGTLPTAPPTPTGPAGMGVKAIEPGQERLDTEEHVQTEMEGLLTDSFKKIKARLRELSKDGVSD